jgi:hypothetical protein
MLAMWGSCGALACLPSFAGPVFLPLLVLFFVNGFGGLAADLLVGLKGLALNFGVILYLVNTVSAFHLWSI